MRQVLVVIAAIALALPPATCAAQQTAVAVQLPTFSQFSVNTTVLAPDSGAGYRTYLERLGMLDSATCSNLWNNGPDGRPVHQPRMPIGEEPLAAPGGGPAPRRASSAERTDESVASIRRQQQAADARTAARATAEVAALYQRGQAAEAAGKSDVARIYYQMAARRATGNLRVEIVARLKALPTSSSDKR